MYIGNTLILGSFLFSQFNIWLSQKGKQTDSTEIQNDIYDLHPAMNTWFKVPEDKKDIWAKKQYNDYGIESWHLNEW